MVNFVLVYCNFLLIKAGCDIFLKSKRFYDKPALMPKTLQICCTELPGSLLSKTADQISENRQF